MYARRYSQPVEKVEDPTIPARIDTLLGNGQINDWEKNFLTSVKAGFDKYKSLTKGQNDTFVKIEARYDAGEIAKRQAWSASWNEEKNKNWQTMMEYYSKTQYYQGAVEKWKKDKAYIPSEKEYAATCENKYAVRLLKNKDIPPKFKQGALVVYKRYGYKLATVVDIGNITDWSKGSREYQIMVVGEADIRTVLEKELIYYREGIISKLEKYFFEEMPF